MSRSTRTAALAALVSALLVPAAAWAIPQPPHAAADGVECLDCHVPYASLNEPARAAGLAAVGSGPLTLVDPTKAWTDDEWQEGVVTFTSGANLGQYRYVAGNSADTVRWTLPLPGPLAAGDAYRIGKTTYDDVETKCRSCHNPTGSASAMADVGLHAIGGGRTIGCGDCHDPHNVTPNSGRGAGLVRLDLRWPTSTTDVVFPSGDVNPFLDGAPGFDGVCESCHTETRYHRNDASGDHRHNADVGCTACHPHDAGFQPAGGACNACHGSELSAAPPRALSGSEDTRDVEVGAHRRHLTGGALRGPVSCSSCHLVPGAAGDADHIGPAPAELTFSGLALAAGGPAPSWDRGPATCANTYCHGATLAGGTNTQPRWTVVDGTQAACGTCHGAPPPAPHPARNDCAACHPETVNADGTINVAGGQHIDGDVDLGTACNTCHGLDPARPAPPADLTGHLETTARGVGAHQAHLDGGNVRAGLACTECHVVPADVRAPGHLDAAPADLVFGPLATGGGQVAPSYDPVSERCSNVYCHGALSSGGAETAPRWTLVDGTQAACGTCHGAPPPAPHTDRTDCATCHPGTVNPDGSLNLAGGQHIDGDVDVGRACTDCHGGDAGNAAPPKAFGGAVDTTALGVGAHQRHLAASVLRGPLACTECHRVPETVNAPGHLDAAPADLTFSPLATAGGTLVPTFDRDTGRCANTYCHGATVGGGSNRTPVWTTVDGSQMACGTCHGNPPPAPHPDRDDCNTCHELTVDAAGQLNLAGGRHIDGAVDLNGDTCDACHGTPGNPAPPENLAGLADTRELTVGAHQAHLGGGTLRAPVACTECHVVPGTLLAAGHMDAAPADLTFGALATADGALATWNRVTERCSNVYCHGATLGAGGSNTAPRWTAVDGSQDACGTCHGAPPPPPHPNSPLCSGCHPGTVGADGSIDLAGGLHVNGLVEVVAGDCLACHSTPQAAGLVRRQIVGPAGDFTRPSHHATDGTASQVVAIEDCETCHDQDQHMGNPDPEVFLNDADGNEPHTYDGQGASLEPFCLACHDADGAAAGPAPFSDGLSAPDIATAWAGGRHNTSPAAPLAAEACFACHGGEDTTRPGDAVWRNIHGSAFPSLLSGRVDGRAVANGEEALCLACHGGQVAAADIAAQQAKASTHGLADQTGVHEPTEVLTGTRTHVECVDCHDPHAANGAAAQGQGLPGALAGVAGLDANGNPVQPATRVYEVCYKCHANRDQPLATAIPRLYDQPSLRLDFDTNNPSYHPVEAVGLNPDVPSLRPGWTENSVMTCLDCHNNDTGPGVGGAGPKGPHGSAWPWLLERRYDTGNGGFAFNEARFALCFKCHDWNSIGADASFAYHTLHVQGEQAPCSLCHDPHGSAGATNLINFDLRTVFPNPSGELYFRDDGDRRGTCALTCHEYNHEPEGY